MPPSEVNSFFVAELGLKPRPAWSQLCPPPWGEAGGGLQFSPREWVMPWEEITFHSSCPRGSWLHTWIPQSYPSGGQATPAPGLLHAKPPPRPCPQRDVC